MGFLSSLFGGGVNYVGRNAAEEQQLQLGNSLAGEAVQNRGISKLRLADIADTTREEAKARGTANANVMQQTSGGNFNSTHPGALSVDRALVRGRALAKMGWAGANSAQAQGFHEKLAASRFGQAFRFGQAGGLSTLANNGYDNTATDMGIERLKSAGAANALGTLGGAALSLYANRTKTPAQPAGWYKGNSYADLNPTTP